MNCEAKRKWIVIVLAVLLVASLVANGILAAMLIKQPDDPSLSLYDPEYAIGKDDQTIVPEETAAPSPDQVISNSYIELICPDELKDQLNIITTRQDDDVTTVFSSVFEEKELELFTFSMTKEEPTDCYILGELQDAQDGTIYVGMYVNDIQPEGWSEDLYNEICMLQERVNDFIIQFYEDARFVPNH